MGFGEDQVSERQVEVSLKFFDCGHFYLKQSLPGSGPTPYQVVYEGRYTQTERGFSLQYFLKYTGQTTKASDRRLDNSISILPPNLDSHVAFCNESDNQLNGMIPAFVGSESMCRVEIYREPDVVDKNKARFNEDCPDPLSIEERLMGKEQKPKPKPPPPQEPRTSTSFPEAGSGRESVPSSSSSSTLHQRRPIETKPAVPSAPAAPSSGAASVKQPAVEDEDEKGDDEEPMWPLLLGVGLLLAVLLFFCWLNFQDSSTPPPRVKASPIEDISEDWQR